MEKIFLFLAALLGVVSISFSSPVYAAKSTLLGTAVSPAHFPNSSPEDIKNYFDLASQISSHVTLILEWAQEMPLQDIQNIQIEAGKRGLQFHLQLSPIALYGGRKTPAIPSSVSGKSFQDESVRTAYKAKILQLASFRPDYLGLGTEVNLLVQNPSEFKAYVSLTREAYQRVKAQNPGQVITISFQWDIMLTQKQFDILPQFKNSLDVYSFTTYPGFFKDVYEMPVGFYSAVRKLLPVERVGFSEIGWNSSAGSDEDMQAKFYAKLPFFMADVYPEFLTLGLLHDVKAFGPELEALNSVGVRRADGSPKKSWDVVQNLEFKP